MKEQTKKIVEELSVIAEKYGADIECNTGGVKISLSHRSESKRIDQYKPSCLVVSVVETERYDGIHKKSNKLDIYEYSLGMPRNPENETLLLHYSDTRGLSFLGKNVTIYLNKESDAITANLWQNDFNVNDRGAKSIEFKFVSKE